MKKFLFVLLVVGVLFFSCGCVRHDLMEDIDIVTTIYPIEYVINRLYADNSYINSIYPKGIVINEYEFTDKQISDFSKKDLFIYNGQSDEREYATTMLNLNNNLKIIDASYGIDVNYRYSDVWLNPSNILMMAQNIRTELEEYITNPYLIEEIDSRYDLLKVDISELDTEFTKTADNSTDKRIIVYDETLKFLEKYGFNIINLTEKGEIKENNLSLAKSLLKSGDSSYIYITENVNSKNSVISNLTSEYNAKTLTFKTAEIITEDDVDNNDDYLSIMHSNIDLIKKETYQ